MVGWIDGRVHRLMDSWIDGEIKGQMDRRMDGWINRQMDGFGKWTDGVMD